MRRIDFSIGDEIAENKELVLLLGNFDGVHLGHRYLVDKALDESKKEVGVLLFSDNIDIFIKGNHSSVLSDAEDKIRIFSSLGIDVAYVMKIDRQALNCPKKTFIDKVLRKINPSLLVCGEDYRFGKGREGTPDDLKKEFEVDCLPLLESEGQKISSGNISSLLSEGKIREANRLLGRHYEIRGKITKGYGNGAKIGFKTANLSLAADYVLPPNGVYATLSFLRGIPHLSLTNIGNNPTLGLSDEITIETHILGFDDDAYGETLYVSFMDKIRDEIKFDSIEALKSQIEEDVEKLKDSILKESINKI